VRTAFINTDPLRCKNAGLDVGVRVSTCTANVRTSAQLANLGQARSSSYQVEIYGLN
jgi:hypothetical protein